MAKVELAIQTPDFWRDKSVLVTGARGFIGSWLAKALIDRGATVTTIMRDQTPSSNFDLLGLTDRVNVVRGSVTDANTVARAINEYDVDTCYHLAAQAIVTAANRSPLSTWDSNVRGTWTVLDACRTSVNIERVVLASSDKAYGAQSQLPYTEEMPLLGVNPYDASKVCADVLARSYAKTFALPVAVARCANVYGGGDLNFSRLIPGTIRDVLQRQRPIVRSDGSPVRDYIFVDDAVSAYLLLAEKITEPGVTGSAFNFGSGDPRTVLDVVDSIVEVCDSSHIEPDIRGAGVPSGEIDRQYLDSTRADDMLGWRASIPFTDGLRRAVGWYREWMAIRRSTEDFARRGAH